MKTINEYLSKKPKPLNTKATAKLNTNRTFHFIIANDGGRLCFYHDGVQINPKKTKDFTMQGLYTKTPSYTRWERVKRGLNYSFEALRRKDDHN